jgi:hypothetical protein
MRRIVLSVLCLATVVSLGTFGIRAASASRAVAGPDVRVGAQGLSVGSTLGRTYWKLTMKWDGVAPTPSTYLLDPLIKNGTKLSGTVVPPNSACPGTISGSLVSGKFKITITYPGTGCNGDKATLTGQMNLKKGTTKGTFTANYHCPGTCHFTGKKTAS